MSESADRFAGPQSGGLVVSRTVGEAVDVSGACRVIFHRQRRGRIQIRILAEPDVKIQRAELNDREAA